MRSWRRTVHHDDARLQVEIDGGGNRGKVRAHFRYELDQIQRRLREHVRRGQMFLGVGLAVLVVFLTLAELTVSLPSGTLREILREGFVITGWVAMWRPLEVLLYDWWPMVDERRLITRLLEASVSIRYDADAVPAGGSGDAIMPLNMTNSPTFSGVSNPTI